MKLVVIYVFATWCAPCHIVEERVEEWANKRGITILAVDYDDTGKELLAERGYKGVPALVIGNRVFSPYTLAGWNESAMDHFVLKAEFQEAVRAEGSFGFSDTRRD